MYTVTSGVLKPHATRVMCKHTLSAAAHPNPTSLLPVMQVLPQLPQTVSTAPYKSWTGVCPMQPWHLPSGECFEDFPLTRPLLSLSSSLENLCISYRFAVVGCACGGVWGESHRVWVDSIFQPPLLSWKEGAAAISSHLHL